MAAATVQVNVRIEPKLYAQLKAKAQKDGLTVTAAVGSAIHDYVSREKGAA